MKSLCLFFLVPVVFSAKLDQRFILDSFGVSLKDVEHALISTLGSDMTEQACEASCPAVIGTIPGGSLVAGVLCPQACKSLQSAAQGKKRFILDSFGVSLKDVENALISTLGSDMTEQACEASCPAVIGTIPGGSLVAGVLCPQACKSLQSAAQGRRRFILDSFGVSLKDVENALISTLGSDMTEQACEASCPAVIGTIPGGSLVAGVLCPQACKSLQSAAQGRKRFILDSFGVSLKDVENALISTLGSDMTEQACEASCPAVIGTIPGGSLVAGVLCPQACKSLQSAAQGRRRFILDSFGVSLKDVENALISTLGSDMTEQACEASCPAVIGTIPGGSLVAGVLCPQACKSLQSAAQGKKRFILDSFGVSLKDVENALISTLGSDMTEQACEASCPAVIGTIPGGSLVAGVLCPQACKSLQSAAQGRKRFILDSFGVSLKDVENALISTLGSDMTEQACEASCPAVVGTIPGGSLVAGVLCPQACKRHQNQHLNGSMATSE